MDTLIGIFAFTFFIYLMFILFCVPVLIFLWITSPGKAYKFEKFLDKYLFFKFK